MRFPDSGPAWSSRRESWPDQDRVGHCYGNCGPGCGQYDTWLPVCGTPEQYWELDVLSSPQLNTTGQTCFCADGNNLYECGQLSTYYAAGRWTYHGWKAAGCYTHDTTCRTPWWASLFLGYFGIVLSPGGLAADLWVLFVSNPYINCRIDFASWAYGGMCAGAGADQWSYDTTIWADEFAHDYYEYREPGSCASGPPHCGDGICQTHGCLLGDSEAGHAPGNGCEEDTNGCSDCS